MELRQLRYFIAVAEERGVNRAAVRLQMAQPPLSQQMKKLERELGVLLFHRTSKGVDLTDAGEGLLAEAYTVVANLDRIPPRVRAADAGQTGHLSIACVSAAFGGLASSLLRAFSVAHPAVQLEARELHSREQYDALENQLIDLGIVRSDNPAPHLVIRKIYEERLLVAVPSNHPLCAVAELRIQDLADEPLIFFSRHVGSWYFDHLVRVCQDEGGFSPTIRYQSDNLLTQLGMVGAGLGVAIVTELSQQFQVPGVVFRELSGLDAGMPLYLMWDSRRRNPAIHHFHRVIDSWAPEAAWKLT